MMRARKSPWRGRGETAVARRGRAPYRAHEEGELAFGFGWYHAGGLGATDAIHTPGFRLANKSKVTLITLTSAMNNHLMDPE